jgi:hypothetical protein
MRDLGRTPPLRQQRLDARDQIVVAGELGGASDGASDPMLRAAAASPVALDCHMLGIALQGDEDPIQHQARDLLAVGRTGAWGLPDRRNIRGQGRDGPGVARAQPLWRLRQELLMLAAQPHLGLLVWRTVLPDASRGKAGDRPVDQWLLQPHPASFDARLPQPGSVRKADRIAAKPLSTNAILLANGLEPLGQARRSGWRGLGSRPGGFHAAPPDREWGCSSVDRKCRPCSLSPWQHVLTAAAMNLIRLGAWFAGTPLARTRQSAFTRLMTLPISA